MVYPLVKKENNELKEDPYEYFNLVEIMVLLKTNLEEVKAFQLEAKPANEIIKQPSLMENTLKKCKRIRVAMYFLFPISTYGSLIQELIPAALTPMLMKDYDYSTKDIGLLYSAMNICAIPFLIFSSKLIKKFGYKWIFVFTNWGLFLTSTIIMIGAYLNNYVVIFLGYLAIGMFVTFNASVSGCLTNYWHHGQGSMGFASGLLRVGAN